MKEAVVRIRIPIELYKKFKHVCIDKDVSIPIQTANLIKKFIENENKIHKA